MTTTNVSTMKKYCANSDKWCEFANLQGFCTLTACCNCSEKLNNSKDTQTYITEDRDTRILDAWQVKQMQTERSSE